MTIELRCLTCEKDGVREPFINRGTSEGKINLSGRVPEGELTESEMSVTRLIALEHILYFRRAEARSRVAQQLVGDGRFGSLAEVFTAYPEMIPGEGDARDLVPQHEVFIGDEPYSIFPPRSEGASVVTE